MTTPVRAAWSIHLFTECPNCNEHVDLLDYADFWVDRTKFMPREHMTPKADDLDVVCPNCAHPFNVKCEY